MERPDACRSLRSAAAAAGGLPDRSATRPWLRAVRRPGSSAVLDGIAASFLSGSTPLEPANMPAHLGTVAVDGAGEPIAQESADSRRRAAEANCKDGKRGSHGRPQPSPGGSFLGRRFVHEDLRLIGQGTAEFPVGLCECLGDLVLHLDGQGRAARLAEQVFKEQCGPPLALPKVCHQQSRERHEPRSRLAGRHTRRQCRAGRFAAARASEPMPLVFRHKRPDLGQFPDLMPQRGGIRSRQPRSAPPACGGLERFCFVAVCRRNQRPIDLAVPRLPAPIPLRLRSRRMRMLAARRQRRVLRCLRALELLQPLLELSNFRQKKPHHCLGVWRPLRNLFFGDLQRHTLFLAATGPREKPSFQGFAGPGCERLP